MSPRSKKEYLEAIFPRYKAAKSKEQKTKIINELCETCKYHRKHAIRLLSKFKRFNKPKSRKRGKPSIYNQPPILAALERIWKDASMPCSKRLVTIIPLWLPHYPGALNLPVIKALKKISAPTIDRILKTVRKKYNRINLS
ncbi:MAG: integrase, partial [Candidatus Omnitrophica bacterium]|nr:integrase [Candidatus Omnitrophota bacterium]